MSLHENHRGQPAFLAWPEPAGDQPDVAVVTPMLNEAGGAAAFIAEIAAALSGRNFEIIVVNDGSTDDTGAIVKTLKAEIPQLRIVEHGENAGQSRALRSGVLAARAHIIAMLDGDGQNDPADIPQLLAVLEAGNDGNDLAMVAGERRDRQDTAAKKWASNLANNIRRALLKDGAIDTGCGLKVFYREAFLRLPYFDHMHRYLPALMRREEFAVAFVPVSHRARMHGASKYTNFGRFLVAIRDLTGVLWLMARSRSPKSIREVDD
ncbi:Dolichol-phosphate mannosyltransferase [hydrothermal vent metagenome]|uniref:Dolichol-phosphate mannosyltransferase n=1 Tax=hydrothermal vent metagenome TaxID=652676 RepID=A0A3B0SVD0_9ZZZZ